MASPAKLQATVEAVSTQETAPAHASAARTWPISVHLTNFAPGLERVGINDKRRWATFYGRTPNQVVRATLTRCRLSSTEVSVERAADGGADLLAPAPPELERFLSSEPGRPVPFASFWDGLDVDQLQLELADLRRRGWSPPAPVDGRDD